MKNIHPWKLTKSVGEKYQVVERAGKGNIMSVGKNFIWNKVKGPSNIIFPVTLRRFKEYQVGEKGNGNFCRKSRFQLSGGGEEYHEVVGNFIHD